MVTACVPQKVEYPTGLRRLGSQSLDVCTHAGSWQPFYAVRIRAHISSPAIALTKEEFAFCLLVG